MNNKDPSQNIVFLSNWETKSRIQVATPSWHWWYRGFFVLTCHRTGRIPALLNFCSIHAYIWEPIKGHFFPWVGDPIRDRGWLKPRKTEMEGIPMLPRGGEGEKCSNSWDIICQVWPLATECQIKRHSEGRERRFITWLCTCCGKRQNKHSAHP
jgi:hypothetical protein